jgi:hypothetical protein
MENDPQRKRQAVTLSALAGSLDTTPDRLYTDPWKDPPPDSGAAPKLPTLPGLKQKLRGQFAENGQTYELDEESLDSLADLILKLARKSKGQ